MNLTGLNIKIFADGADLAGMMEMARKPWIAGFTTNPTLMRRAGVTDYETFAREIVASIKNRPVSFEVISDDFDEMLHQARRIGSWSENIYVKIPITNTKGKSCAELMQQLSSEGIKINATALLTLDQVRIAADALRNGPAAIISVLAGRIADTGMDPLPVMTEAVRLLRRGPNLELLWGSPREIYNIFQAANVGCHIITVTHELLKKLDLIGKDLNELSLDTVKMFYEDAKKAGYRL